MSAQPGTDGGFARLAMASEAPRIADLQRAAWQDRGLADVLPDAAEVVASWRQAILCPPLATYRVLVALNTERTEVTGFAAVGPSDDPDAEQLDGMVGEFVIDSALQRRGHGSRLMHAVVDTLHADGFIRATWWVTSTDDVLRAFLVESGWAPDGAHREVGTEQGELRIKQIRLHTTIV